MYICVILYVQCPKRPEEEGYSGPLGLDVETVVSSLRWPPEELSVLLAAEVPPETLHFQQTQSMPSPNLHGDLVSWLKMHTLTPARPAVDICHHCPGAASVGAELPHVGMEKRVSTGPWEKT